KPTCGSGRPKTWLISCFSGWLFPGVQSDPRQSTKPGRCDSMTSAQITDLRTRSAHKPFYFNTSAHLLRIGRERATNLSELLQALRACSEDSIFQHTFRTLEEHHFIREGFSNDFAHWAFSACNEPGLAERLASIDVREFTSVEAVRERFVHIVEAY